MQLRSMQAGFAMIEVMVTVAIITVGISGMGMLLIRAIQGTQDSAQQSQAMWIVQDYVGRMRANPEGALARFYELDPNNLDCSTPPTMCAEIFKDGDEVASMICDATTMATFDNWITSCDLNSGIYDSASDFIVNPNLTSTCTATSARQSQITFADSCVQYQVTLTWDTKITTASSVAEERINQNTYNLIVEFN